MEEKTMTPEQHEMEVYEDYLECYGAEDVIQLSLDAIQEAEGCLRVMKSMMSIEGSPIDNPAVQSWARENIARIQVFMNMMELVFGDTADEADALISGLNEVLVGHGAM